MPPQPPVCRRNRADLPVDWRIFRRPCRGASGPPDDGGARGRSSAPHVHLVHRRSWAVRRGANRRGDELIGTRSSAVRSAAGGAPRGPGPLKNRSTSFCLVLWPVVALLICRRGPGVAVNLIQIVVSEFAPLLPTWSSAAPLSLQGLPSCSRDAAMSRVVRPPVSVHCQVDAGCKLYRSTDLRWVAAAHTALGTPARFSLHELHACR